MRALAALAAALAAAMVWSGGAAEADAYTVEPFNRVMEVAEGANVRAGPGPDYAVRVTLNEGVKVRVTGAVRGRGLAAGRSARGRRRRLRLRAAPEGNGDRPRAAPEGDGDRPRAAPEGDGDRQALRSGLVHHPESAVPGMEPGQG